VLSAEFLQQELNAATNFDGRFVRQRPPLRTRKGLDLLARIDLPTDELFLVDAREHFAIG
jgi:hypothetical protein